MNGLIDWGGGDGLLLFLGMRLIYRTLKKTAIRKFTCGTYLIKSRLTKHKQAFVKNKGCVNHENSDKGAQTISLSAACNIVGNTVLCGCCLNRRVHCRRCCARRKSGDDRQVRAGARAPRGRNCNHLCIDSFRASSSGRKSNAPAAGGTKPVQSPKAALHNILSYFGWVCRG